MAERLSVMRKWVLDSGLEGSAPEDGAEADMRLVSQRQGANWIARASPEATRRIRADEAIGGGKRQPANHPNPALTKLQRRRVARLGVSRGEAITELLPQLLKLRLHSVVDALYRRDSNLSALMQFSS